MNYHKFNQRIKDAPTRISEADIEVASNTLQKKQAIWGRAVGFFMVASIVAVLISSNALSTKSDNAHAWTWLAAMLTVGLVLSTMQHIFFDSMLSKLTILSTKSGSACQEALALCAAIPQACELRDELLAAGRPIRVMHLDAMRKLDAHGLSEQQAKERSCKALHGV